MITARNYAAEVEHALDEFKAALLKAKKFQDYDAVCSYQSRIKNCQHFAIPDTGKFLDDNAKGLLDSKIRLPYPVMTIEYFCKDLSNSGIDVIDCSVYKNDKTVILATEKDNGFNMVIMSQSNGKWAIHPTGMFVSYDSFRKGFNSDNFYTTSTLPNWASENYHKMSEAQIASNTAGMIEQAVFPIVELLEALSCKNVYTESLGNFNHKKKNERLIKAGKLPLYETKILVVDSAPKTIDKTDLGGTHASPRQHLRRGHIRRYATYSIWINNTIVGKASTGKIDKSYEVK